jgi:hypothetical protein
MLFTIAAIFAIGLFFTVALRAQTSQVSFPAGVNKVSQSFKTADNLVLIDVGLNGKTGTFIFDTGAESTVVNSSFAKSVGLVNKGTTKGNGSAGSATAGIIRGVKLSLGGITVDGTTVYSLPIDAFAPALGFKIAGILGNDIIGKLVAEVDHASSKLTLYQRSAFSPPTSGQKIDLMIQGGLPFIRANVIVDGKRTIPGKLEIDTGSTGALLLNSPFVRKYQLTRTLSNYLDAKTGGVGGTGTSKIARIQGVSLGSFNISQPVAQLYTGTKGDNASTSYDGLLGSAIFRRFRMIIDMAGKRLYLEPNNRLNEEFDTDMTGMSLVADGDDLSSVLIDEVRPESAAAKAGIAEGDVIVSINGRSNLPIQEVRRLFRIAGEYDLSVKRGDRVLNIHLTLKRVI